MKYILSFMFILCLLQSKAQGIFGGTHQQVRDTLTKIGYPFFKSDKATDGTYFDVYKVDDKGSVVACYFNTSGDCYQYRKIMVKSGLIEDIEYLNKNYIKVDDSNWINKKATVKVRFFVNESDPDFYYLIYRSMVVKEN